MSVPLTAASPTVVVAPQILGGFDGPVRVRLHVGTASVDAWAWSTSTPGLRDVAATIDETAVGITHSVRRHVDVIDGSTVLVVVPELCRPTVLAARIDDLPGATVVQVPTSDNGPPDRYFVRNGIATCVTATPRDHVPDGAVRVNFQLRLLTEAPGHDGTASVALVVREPNPLRTSGRLGERAWRALRVVADELWEGALRIAFRAPAVVVRVTQAHPGDDDPQITLHPSVFDRIGLSPGQQVLVRWGDREIVVPALADHLPHDANPAPATIRGTQRVDRINPGLPPDFSPHLVARLSAAGRHLLGCPPSSVVVVRRRLRPALIRNLGVLVVPLFGLVLAAAALDDPDWRLIVGGTVLVSAFGLARLRIPRAPATARRPWGAR